STRIECVLVVELLELERATINSTSALRSPNEWIRTILGLSSFGELWSRFTPGERDEIVLLLERHADKVLYIFDGFDEIQNTTNCSVIKLLRALHNDGGTDNERCFARNVLVTSRPERRYTMHDGAVEFPLFEGWHQFQLQPWSRQTCYDYVRQFPV